MHENIFFFFFNCFCILKVLMKTGYFNTGFVFLRHKIQIDNKQKKHKSKGGKITNIEKYLFILIFFEMGRSRPKYMGWANLA